MQRNRFFREIFPVRQFVTTKRICTKEIQSGVLQRDKGFGTATISVGHLRIGSGGADDFTTVDGLQWEEREKCMSPMRIIKQLPVDFRTLKIELHLWLRLNENDSRIANIKPKHFPEMDVSCSLCSSLKKSKWAVLFHCAHHGHGSGVKKSKCFRTVFKRGIINFVIFQGGIFNSRRINPSLSLSLICINTIIDSLLTVH